MNQTAHLHSESWISLDSNGQKMSAFQFLPPQASPSHRAPAVIVIQEAFGVNENIQAVCRRLASEGFIAVAPDLFHRGGDRIVLEYSELPRAIGLIAELTNEDLEADVRAALTHLRQVPQADAKRISIIGYCLGGFVALLAACRLPVASAVSYYGGGIVRARPGIKLQPLTGEIPRITCPLLCFFGEEDHAIPADDVSQLRALLGQNHSEHEVVVYAGAGHGFAAEGREPHYEPHAAQDAWKRTLEFLRS